MRGDRTGTLEPNADKPAVVQRIFRWCVEEGLTTYEIAKRLCAKGVPTRADTDSDIVHKRTARHYWDPTTVGKMLRNETYKGVWHWNKTRRVKRGERVVQEPRPRHEWLTVSVPALVDEAIWEQAQARLDQNKVTARRNAKREYLLRGLVFCPSCGRRWTGRYKNSFDQAYYRCPTTEGEPWRTDCSARFGIEQARLASSVLATIKAFLLDPETRTAGIAAEQERLASERQRLNGHLLAIDQHLAKVDRRLGAVLDDMLTAGFPSEIIEPRKQSLLVERERCVQEREQVSTRLTAVDIPDLEAAIAALVPTVEHAFGVATLAEL